MSSWSAVTDHVVCRQPAWDAVAAAAAADAAAAAAADAAAASAAAVTAAVPGFVCGQAQHPSCSADQSFSSFIAPFCKLLSTTFTVIKTSRPLFHQCWLNCGDNFLSRSSSPVDS